MKNLLIVDDNSVMLRLYEFHISKKGWDGHYLETGEEAIECLTKIKPDVAILDYDLKGMVGTEVYDALRATYPNDSIPVIFITAQIRTDIKKSLLALENATVLAKPFSPALLVQAIESIFNE